MYVIYHGKGDSILTAMAAAIHLGKVNEFCIGERKALGRLVHIGNDEENNQIFILNTSSAETIIIPALSSVFDLLEVPKDSLYLGDTSELGNISISLGLWLFRRGLFRTFASKMVFTGIKKEYESLKKIVERGQIFCKKD